MPKKKWYLSRTLWFNVLTMLVGTIGQLTNLFTFSAETNSILATVLSVGNFILRFLTTQPITGGANAPTNG